MTKKEKIALVKRYFGSVMKDAKKYVEDYDKQNPKGEIYEYIKDFFYHQDYKSFYED